jgi:hypothetical protein
MTRPTCLHAGQSERLPRAPRRPLGAHQRAIGALIDVIWLKGTVAGAEPAHRNGEVATLTRSLVHDVSILIGVGLELGSAYGRTPLFSQRATYPPSAAVRQRSIALITFNWSRLTCPWLASRHAGP